MSETKVFEYTRPCEIDGESSEVVEAVAAQLVEAAKLLNALADESFAQLRNAWMTAELELEPALDPVELGERWSESLAMTTADRPLVLSEALVRAAEALLVLAP